MRSWLEEINERMLSGMGYHDSQFGEQGSYALVPEDIKVKKAEKLAAMNVLHAYAEGYTAGVYDRGSANADKLQDGLRAVAQNNPSTKELPYGQVEDLIAELLARHYPEG